MESQLSGAIMITYDDARLVDAITTAVAARLAATVADQVGASIREEVRVQLHGCPRCGQSTVPAAPVSGVAPVPVADPLIYRQLPPVSPPAASTFFPPVEENRAPEPPSELAADHEGWAFGDRAGGRP